MYMDNNDTISVISASFTASVDLRHKLKGFNKCYCIHFLRIKAISIHDLPIFRAQLFLGKLIFILVDWRLGLCCKIDRLIKAN